VSKPLHLVLGDSAEGCLRAACQSHGLPGTVIGIRDDLSHGPLEDGVERLNYMRAIRGEEECWPAAIVDAFEPWQKLVRSVKGADPESIFIWQGRNVSEVTFLACACWYLRQFSIPLFQVEIAREDDVPYVATHSPVELADMFSSHKLLTIPVRDQLSMDFERIRLKADLLRRWQCGQIVGVAADHYDRLLEESCLGEWLAAAPVVGAAMSLCDKHNLMSDEFFFYRLRLLIDAGRIEASDPKQNLRDCAIRLAKA